MSKYDVAFLITGNPLPAMLDMASYAKNNGLNVLVILLDRDTNDLAIDKYFVNYDVVTINVPYKKLSLSRFLYLPILLRNIYRIIKKSIKPRGVFYSSSFDLLVIGFLIKKMYPIRLRHQVRDLHSLQLAKGIVPSIFVFIEKNLLRKVEKIVISSSEFHEKYYKNIFHGETVLLENIPLKSTWQGFEKKELTDREFVIGFIGIIRYKQSLFTLIDTVKKLNSNKSKYKVIFAGGGDATELVNRINGDSNFEITGPYEYTRDIKNLYRKIDLIYAVYDNSDLNCQIAMPNKFYESIITGIPILVASNTFVGKKVLEKEIGNVVNTGDENELYKVLENVFSEVGWYTNCLNKWDENDAENYFKLYEPMLRLSVF